MPDRDIYDRGVERGWQTAARRVDQGDADELIGSSLLIRPCRGTGTILCHVLRSAR